MGAPESPDTPSDPAGRAAVAFRTLGNETRLSILLALWDAIDPDQGDDPDASFALSFSELFERVDYDDDGNFSYHLDRLVGPYVYETDEGYLLRNAGYSVVEAVIAGAGIDDPELEPTTIDVACEHCGAPTAVAYWNEVVVHLCTECVGNYAPFRDHDDLGGPLSVTVFDPAGLAGRTPREVYDAAMLRRGFRVAAQAAGLCPRCSGVVEGTLFVCADHESTTSDTCSTCGHRWPARPQFVCSVCKFRSAYPPSVPVGVHSAVVEFFADHGIAVGSPTTPASVGRIESLMRAQTAELVATDPPRVRVTVRHDGAVRQVTYDETVTVVDIDGDG